MFSLNIKQRDLSKVFLLLELFCGTFPISFMLKCCGVVVDVWVGAWPTAFYGQPQSPWDFGF